ncbi:uncharacterized protein LOC142924628 [Petromyzon marinus]|uniref:uncharacterized protein LOC142924628 n=1 Tax=Petromyzon marinus TaxID=7757 RepID=UPI003F72C5A6
MITHVAKGARLAIRTFIAAAAVTAGASVPHSSKTPRLARHSLPPRPRRSIALFAFSGLSGGCRGLMDGMEAPSQRKRAISLDGGAWPRGRGPSRGLVEELALRVIALELAQQRALHVLDVLGDRVRALRATHAAQAPEPGALLSGESGCTPFEAGLQPESISSAPKEVAFHLKDDIGMPQEHEVIVQLKNSNRGTPQDQLENNAIQQQVTIQLENNSDAPQQQEVTAQLENTSGGPQEPATREESEEPLRALLTLLSAARGIFEQQSRYLDALEWRADGMERALTVLGDVLLGARATETGATRGLRR